MPARRCTVACKCNGRMPAEVLYHSVRPLEFRPIHGGEEWPPTGAIDAPCCYECRQEIERRIMEAANK